MNKITYFEIAGKKYPLSFSLLASRVLAKKFGSIDKIGEAIGDGMSDVSMETLSFIAATLISQGCAYHNIFLKDVPVYDNAPIDENGKFIPLTQEEIETGVGLIDMETFSKVLLEAMSLGGKGKVETTVPKKPKAAQ